MYTFSSWLFYYKIKEMHGIPTKLKKNVIIFTRDKKRDFSNFVFPDYQMHLVHFVKQQKHKQLDQRVQKLSASR